MEMNRKAIFEPIDARPLESGAVQKLYRFPNGYGASVVKGMHTYGGEEGLWELAVLVFKSPTSDEYKLTYETPITTDVEGHLTDDDVEELLAKINQLPLREGALNDNSVHDHNSDAHDGRSI